MVISISALRSCGQSHVAIPFNRRNLCQDEDLPAVRWRDSRGRIRATYGRKPFAPTRYQCRVGCTRSAIARLTCCRWRLRRRSGGWQNALPQSDVGTTDSEDRTQDPARDRRLSGGYGNFRRNSPASSLKTRSATYYRNPSCACVRQSPSRRRSTIANATLFAMPHFLVGLICCPTLGNGWGANGFLRRPKFR